MKRLSELTFEEVKELYKVNKWLQRQGEEYRDETAYFWCDEYLHGIPSGVDYQISYCQSYMIVNERDFAEFIEYCNDIDRDFELFYKHRDLLKRLTARSEVFEEIRNGYKDISDSKWDLFAEWMTDGVNTLKNHLVDVLQSEYETDPLEVLDCLIENIGDDYETDGEYIYELDVIKYA